MDCDKALPLISAALDREIEPEARARLEAHLRECQPCALTAEAFQQQDAELRRAFAPRREAAAALAARVIERLAAEPSAPVLLSIQHARRVRRLHWALGATAMLAAACLVLALSLPFVNRPAATAPVPNPPPLANLGKGAAVPRPADKRAEPLAELLTVPDGALVAQTRARPEPTAVAAVGERLRTLEAECRRVALPDGSLAFLNQDTDVMVTADRHLEVNRGEVYLEVAKKPGANFVVQGPDRTVTAVGTRLAVRSLGRGTEVQVTEGLVRVEGNGRADVAAGELMAATDSKPAPAPRFDERLDWMRSLVAAAEPPPVAPSVYGGGALLADVPAAEPRPLRLQAAHVDLHLENGFARTTLDQVYLNPGAAAQDGTFLFPLPPGASVSHLAVLQDGRTIEGLMIEHDEARDRFDEAAAAGGEPALAEWVDDHTFRVRVGPLPAGKSKRILLSYTQQLGATLGRVTYRFPAGNHREPVGRWSFHARVKDGAGWSWESPSHRLRAVPDGTDLLLDARETDVRIDRDLTLYVTDPTSTPGEARYATVERDGFRYFLMRYRPELPPAAARPRRDWVFLVETSGDRDPALARTQADVVRTLLKHARPDDTFALVTAGTEPHRFAPEPQPVTAGATAEAIRFVEQTHLVGGLDLGKGLDEAAALLKAGRNPVLVHLGSARPVLGERREHPLRRKLPAGTVYVGVEVGKDGNVPFMKATAEQTGGLYTQITPDETVAWRAFELLARLDAPRLLNLNVVDNEEQTLFYPLQNVISAGEEVCAITRLEAGEPLPRSLTVAGLLDGQPYHRVLKVEHVAGEAGYLPRAWTQLEIERLLDEGPLAHRDRIVTLGLEMSVVTPFTSFLVIDDPAPPAGKPIEDPPADQWAPYRPVEDLEGDALPQRGGDRADAGGTAREVERLLRERPQYRLGLERRQAMLPFTVPRAPGVVGKPGDGAGAGAPPGPPREGGFAGGGVAPLPPGGFGGSASRAGGLPGPDGPPAPAPAPGVTGRSAPPLPAPGGAMGGVPVPPSAGSTRTTPMPTAPEPGGFRKMGPNTGTSRMKVPGEAPRPAEAGATPPVSDRNAQPVAPDAANRAYDKVRSARSRDARETDTLRPASPKQLSSFAFQQAQQRAFRLADIAEEKQLKDVRLRITLPASAGAPWRLPQSDAYERPRLEVGAAFFRDLPALAPGLRTTNESAERDQPAAAPLGTIESAARRRLDAARSVRWRRWTVPAAGDSPQQVAEFDGTGRFRLERRTELGLVEQIVCDGATLWHLYPELRLGSRRPVEPGEREPAEAYLPWIVPPAETLARGADVRAVGTHSVTVTPTDVDAAEMLELTFGPDGSLAERRVLRRLGRLPVCREVLHPEGRVELFDPQNRPLAQLDGRMEAVAAPTLRPDDPDLLVLPLGEPAGQNTPRDRALAQLAAAYQQGDAARALAVFREHFDAPGQRKLGFYVLLCALGHDVESNATGLHVLETYPKDPLARYLATPGALAPGGRSFLDRLAAFRTLERQTELGQFDPQAVAGFARADRSWLGWTLLSRAADASGEAAAPALSAAWAKFESVPGLAYASRYEQARALLRQGRIDEARVQFTTLAEARLRADEVPPIDGAFRQSFATAEDWGNWLHEAAAARIAAGNRVIPVALADAAHRLGDPERADSLLAQALLGATGDDRRTVMLAVIGHLDRTGQPARAVTQLRQLQAEFPDLRDAKLWQYAAGLASQANDLAAEAEFLQLALDVTPSPAPAVLSQLLGCYQRLARLPRKTESRDREALVAHIVTTADRWRAVSPDDPAPCQSAALALLPLGERERAWNYLTTPTPLRSDDAAPWRTLAAELRREGEPLLAARAFGEVFARVPSDAGALWEEATLLQQAGRETEAKQTFFKLAEGDWDGTYRWQAEQAKKQLGEK